MRRSRARLAFGSPDDLGRLDPLDFTTSTIESVVMRFALGTAILTKLQAPLGERSPAAVTLIVFYLTHASEIVSTPGSSSAPLDAAIFSSS